MLPLDKTGPASFFFPFFSFITACVEATFSIRGVTLENTRRCVVDSSHKGLVCSYFIPEGRVQQRAAAFPLPCPMSVTRLPCSSREKEKKLKREEEKERMRQWWMQLQRGCATFVRHFYTLLE